MNVTLAIANHELRRLFKSPLAWVILAVVQFLLARQFLFWWEVFESRGSQFSNYGLTEIIGPNLYQGAAIILLLITPLLTSSSICEERRSGTISLLLSSPISITQLILGKFVSILAFMLLLLGMMTLMPLSLGMGTQLDYFALLSGLIGLTLLVSAFIAIGLFVSTLTRSRNEAAILTFGLLYILLKLNIGYEGNYEALTFILNYLSLLTHYSNFLQGLFDLSDVIYYLIMIVTFLVLSVWRLDMERMN